MNRLKPYKKVILGLVFLFVFLLAFCFCYFVYQEKNKVVKVEATVQYIGEDYIIVVDEEKEEYYIPDVVDYQIGDQIAFSVKNIDSDTKPLKGDIQSIQTISKSVTFVIMDGETSDTNNNTVNENKVLGTQDNVNSDHIVSEDAVNEEEQSDEAAIITYFDNLDASLTNYAGTESVGASLKSGFVTVVDFLFYGGVIKGKTFSELSTTAKLKVLKLALSIDEKIEKHFPNYKEEISDTTGKVYTSVKSKVLELYLNVTTDVCKNHQDTCTSAKQGLRDMKKSFSLTWNFIKEISGVGVSKLAAWYEVWREA